MIERDYHFRVNGIPVSSVIVRRNKLKNGFHTQEDSLVVVDPMLGEITIDDEAVTDVCGDSCPSFSLEIRPKSLSLEDRSWLVDAGWRTIPVESAISLLLKLDAKRLKESKTK
jgi:hypothetical protein